MLLKDMRRQMGRLLGPTFFVCLTAYFSYHLLEGRHGLFALQRLADRLTVTDKLLSTLQKEERDILNKVNLLGSQSICPDLLMERAKDVLGYVHPDEVIVLNPNETSPDR